MSVLKIATDLAYDAPDWMKALGRGENITGSVPHWVRNADDATSNAWDRIAAMPTNNVRTTAYDMSGVATTQLPVTKANVVQRAVGAAQKVKRPSMPRARVVPRPSTTSTARPVQATVVGAAVKAAGSPKKGGIRAAINSPKVWNPIYDKMGTGIRKGVRASDTQASRMARGKRRMLGAGAFAIGASSLDHMRSGVGSSSGGSGTLMPRSTGGFA